MAASRGKLSRKQEEAILALLTQRNVEDAARVAKVAPRTLYRWMKDREFDAAYRDAKRAAFSQSIARMHQMSSAAVSTLGKIMVDPNTPASTRVRAADTILNHTSKAIETEDIVARLAALEEATQTPGQK
jgi:hypothetical protein